MIRSFRYPLLPNKAEDATLSHYLGACCALYNGALQERQDAWNRQGVSIGFNGQCKSLTEIRAADLARRQRALARRKRGSASRRRAVLLVQRAYARVINQRKDTAWKVAGDLVRRFDLIAYEDLSISQMVYGNLAKSIHDASWRLLTHAITCKAEEAGKLSVAVDPRGTSQECSGCGAMVRKGLSVRVHSCAECGLVIDRDENAGLNIKARALGRSAVSKPGADPGKVRSRKPAGAIACVS